MKSLLKQKIVQYFLSALLFGAIYSLLSLLVEGTVELDTVLCSTAVYFGLMCLMYFAAPKLRKWMGYDNNKR